MTIYEGSPFLEDNPTKIGHYVFERHEGLLYVTPNDEYERIYEKRGCSDHKYESELCVDRFPELIDALYSFKKQGLDIKLTSEDFKKLVEYSLVAYRRDETLEDVLNDWVNFNRYDFIKDYGRFRRIVLIRDDYQCQLCGNNNEDELQVHHIRSFKDNLELATSVKNGVTLCEACHKKYHDKYGWNGNQETFSKFIEESFDSSEGE